MNDLLVCKSCAYNEDGDCIEMCPLCARVAGEKGHADAAALIRVIDYFEQARANAARAEAAHVAAKAEFDHAEQVLGRLLENASCDGLSVAVRNGYIYSSEWLDPTYKVERAPVLATL